MTVSTSNVVCIRGFGSFPRSRWLRTRSRVATEVPSCSMRSLSNSCMSPTEPGMLVYSTACPSYAGRPCSSAMRTRLLGGSTGLPSHGTS